MKLLEKLVCGESERGGELTVSAAKARWSSGWRAEGRKGGV
jgi:hypothetical protein